MSNGYLMKQANPARRNVPLIQVSFHTATTCYQLKGQNFDSLADFTAARKIDPSLTVMSVSTTKNMDTPAGTFSVQLVGDEWMDKLSSNDLVVIQMGYKKRRSDPKDTPTMSTVMVGLIDTRQRARSAQSSLVTTTITGRDFGKILIKDNLKFYPEIGAADPSAQKEGQKFFLTDEGWITLMSFFTNENIAKGTPATVLDVIMRFILPKLNDVDWTVWDETKQTPTPKSVGVTNILRYNFAKVGLFILPTYMAADTLEGSLWNLMERAAPKPFVELFVDVRDSSEAWNPGNAPRVVNEVIEQASDVSKASFPVGNGYYPAHRSGFGSDNSAVMVAMRNTPFNKDLWERLYTHELDAADVIEESLSLSDNDHYNVFWAGTTINPLGFDLKRTSPPLWNEDMAKRYGLSPLEVQVEGLALDQSDPTQEPSLKDLSQGFSAKLKAWFENNQNYMSGDMIVQGKGNYRIGQRLLRKGLGKEFYIEGVTQNFHVLDEWTTTLQVTRGMDIGTAPDYRKYLQGAGTSEAPQKPTSEKTDSEIKTGFYTVKSGDTLYTIAAKPEIYGDGSQWTKLWDANKEMLITRDSRNISDNGKYLYVGQVLRVPRG